MLFLRRAVWKKRSQANEQMDLAIIYIVWVMIKYNKHRNHHQQQKQQQQQQQQQ
jgi:hypothetical protein